MQNMVRCFVVDMHVSFASNHIVLYAYFENILSLILKVILSKLLFFKFITLIFLDNF